MADKATKKCMVCEGTGLICRVCGKPPERCVCDPVQEEGSYYFPPRSECPQCGGWGFIQLVD